MQDTIIIDGHEISSNENKELQLNVGTLPSDTVISIHAHIYRGKEDGPTLLFLGGVHGDEINGVESIRHCIEEGYFEKITKGTIIAIPLLNVFGFINFSREVPDGKDVNRSFPGTTLGSLASRVARTLTKKILPHVDYAFDFHTGGASRYNYPQIRYTKDDMASLELAKVFNAPFTIMKATIPNSFRRSCKDLNIPAIIFEGGESIRLDGFAISAAVRGIINILRHFKCTNNEIDSGKIRNIHIKKTTWERAAFSGLFTWSKKSGTKIQIGEPLGTIKNPFGTKTATVISRRNGYIIGHNNASVVNQGDALFHIGYEAEEI